MRNHQDIGYALLRVTLGVVFLVFGIGKFRMGVGEFASMMEKLLTGKLPIALVSPFAHVLPFAEVLIGTLLILGLFNGLALVLAGLFIIALTFGTAITSQGGVVAQNVSYGLVIFVLLWTSDNNGYSIDRFRGRR